MKKGLIEFRKEFARHAELSSKEEICLDQMKILSLRYIENGDAVFRLFCPEKLELPIKIKNFRLKGQESWALEKIEQTGIAFIYEDEILLADKEIYKSFADLFGMSLKSCQPSFWRDLHLADIMRTEGFACGTVHVRDGRKVLCALHRSELNSIEANLMEFMDGIMDRYGANFVGWDCSPTTFEVYLSIPGESHKGWEKGLVIRDSEVGRESLTVYSAWHKMDTYIYMDCVRFRHRTAIGLDEMLDKIEKLLKEAEIYIPEAISKEDIIKAMNGVLTLKKMRAFKEFLEVIDFTSGPDLLERIGCFTHPQLSNMDQTGLRLALGTLIRGEASC